MDYDEGYKAGLILNALELVVVDLIAGGVLITKENLVDQLEHDRREAGNIIGKRANRDAAELERKGQ